MNHIHRTVWKHRRQARTRMAIAESASGAGPRSNGSGPLLAGVLVGAALASSAQAADPSATTLPTGAVVTAGQAGIAHDGTAMTITQTSPKAAIEWNSFSIGKDATVNFVQPNASAVALNRVKGSEGSVIDGALNANGQVFILNPNGVLFGKGARVDTAGMVATTLGLSDADFLAGKTTFSGKGGNVSNLGTLNAKDGGYIALLGGQVSNQGLITAKAGTVAMAAGNKISLRFSDDALVGVAVDEAALAALVANGQAIHADGGLVVMTAKAAEGLLDTAVNNTGEVRARTIENKAGRIFLLGEGGGVDVAGTLDASAPHGGNGGAIETSGPVVRVAKEAKVTTAAAKGANGTWLIDPTDFTITAGTIAQSTSGIGATTLQNALAAGNVTIQTQASGSDAGDINVNAAVAWSANKLTLEAHRNINVNAIMTASGTSTLDLKTGYNFNTASPSFNTTASVLVGIDTTATPTFKGRIDFDRAGTGLLTINNNGYTLINALGSAGSTTTTDLQGISGDNSGRYALAGNIDASATSGWSSGAGFAPLSLTGVFDGLGHTVSGLTVNLPSGSYVGMFGTNSGTIRNIGLTNATVTADQGVGILAGMNMGRLSNAITSGTVSGTTAYVGGAIGAIFDGPVANVHSAGTVTSVGTNIGGLSGYLAYQVLLSDSSSSATVTGTQWTGGLIGQNDYGYISGSHATGNVTGTVQAGGLVGSNNNGRITGSYATGAVTGTSSVGGLIGESSMSGSSSSDNTISTSYATGGVTGSGNNVGGLIGNNNGNAVNDTYARGAVTGSGNNVGGLIGTNAGAVTNSYATGLISANGSGVGGLVGTNTGSASNSFWDTQTTGKSTSDGGTGKTSAQMKVDSLYTDAGWNFTFHSGIWGRKSTLNDGYPVLRTFGYADPITITLDNAALTKSYGAANPTLGTTGWTVSGCDNNLTCLASVDWGTAVTATTAVGSYSYTAADTLAVTLGTGYGKPSDYEITISPGSLTVNKATLTVTGTSAADKAYDRSTTATITAGTLSGLANGETLTLTATGTFDSANAGSRTATALFSLGDGTGANAGLASNYQLASATATGLAATISPLAVNVSATTGRVYDTTASADASLLAVTNALVGDTVTLSGTATLAGAGVGLQSITGLTGLSLSNGNYTLTGASIGTGVTVTPRLLTVLASSGATRQYNGTTVAATNLFDLDGVLTGDSVSLTGSATLAGKDVGTQAITDIGGLAINNSNYTLAGTPFSGSVVVTALPVNLATVVGATRQYDGEANANAALLQVNNAISGDIVTLSGNATLSAKDAGDRTVAGFGGLTVSNSNYTLIGATASGSVKITPKTLDVQVRDGATRHYDGTAGAAADLLVLSGMIAGDSASLTGGTAILAGKDVGVRALTGLGSLTLSNSNYTLAEAGLSGNVTVTALPVQVAGLGSRVYDGTAAVAASLLRVANVASGDTVNLGGTATLVSKNAGSQSIGDFSGLTLDNGNYTLVGATTASGVTITPLRLSVAATNGATRVYDASNMVAASLLAVGGTLAGDSVTLSGSATLASANIGVQSLTGLSGLSVGNGNYMLPDEASGSVTITPRVVSVVAPAGATRVYDGSAIAAASLLQVNGLLAGDSVTLSGSAALAARDVGDRAITSVSGLSLNNGNYVLSDVPGGSVAITARPVNVAVRSGASRDSDGSADAAASLLLLGGVLAGDNVSLSGSAILSGTVGNLEIASLGSLALSNGNYTLAGGSTSGTLVVTARVRQGGNNDSVAQALRNDSVAQALRTEVPAVSQVLGGANVPVTAQFTPMAANVTTATPSLTATFGADAPLNLISSPNAGELSESVTLEEARRLIAPPPGQAGGGQNDVRVPVSRNSIAEIVNGGVNLPGGVDQLLFVVKGQ